jgi:flagellin FlaB
MERRYMERLVGKYCKIVTKEPGESRASVVTGILEDVDYKDGFILVDSNQGLGCLRISTIVAIKPGKRRPEHKIKADDEAAVGIGTLIVFIAMVLVAAVAASVVMQTSETLQQRAYAVGKQTIRDVSSGIRIIGVTGYTNAEKNVMEYLAVAVTPRAGSYDIDLNKTLLYIMYDNFTILGLNHADNDAVSGSVSQSGVFHTLNMTNITSTKYGVIAIHDSDDSIVNSYGLQKSDQAVLIVNLTDSLPENGGLLPGEELQGKLVPEVGAAGVFTVSAPNAFKYRVEEL